MTIEFHCCICGKSAPEAEVITVELDGGDQMLWAHRSCLRTVIEPTVPLRWEK